MKQLSLKLRQQGLLIVCSFLLLELLFVAGQFWLLHRAEEETLAQERARTIIDTSTDLMQSLFNAGDNVGRYATSHNRRYLEQYQRSRQEIGHELTFIKEQLQQNPQQQSRIESIEKSIDQGLSMLDEMRHVSDTEPELVTMAFVVRSKAKMQKQLEGLTGEMLAFLKEERATEKMAPEAIKTENDRIRYLLWLGVALNVAAAFTAARLFSSSINQRLQVVVQNSERLTARRSLHPPLAGNDEIALLDQAFHKMSQSLRSEEQLIKASQEQMRALIEQMPIGLLLLNETGSVVYANPILEKTLGYKAGVLKGMSLKQLLPGLKTDSRGGGGGGDGIGDGDGADDGIFHQAIEVEAVKECGDLLPVQFSLAQIGASTKREKVALIVDISKKKELEKLRQNLLAMVSHDLRNPLASVAGFLELLPKGIYGLPSDAAVRCSRVALKEANQLICLINDLLDLEKLEASKVSITNGMVNLEDMVDEAVDNCVELAEQTSTTVLFEGCREALKTDAVLLAKATTKLLESLLRIAPRADTITIQVRSTPDAASVTFSCSKLRLPSEIISDIYEPFHSINVADISSNPGLGLALARALIVQLGGRVEARNEPQSCLWYELPRAAMV